MPRFIMMNVSLFKQFLPYFRMLVILKLPLSGGVLFGIVNGATSGIGLPFLIYKVFPVIFSDPPPGLLVLSGAVVLFPFTMFIRGASGFISTYLMSYCGVQLLARIRLNMHKKLQKMPLAFFHRNTSGDLYSRIIQDTAVFQRVVVETFIEWIKQPVQLIGAVGTLFYLSIQQREMLFMLLFVAVVPVCIVPLRLVGRRLLKRATQLQDEVGNLSQIVSETLSATREVRAFNLQERQLSRFKNTLASFCRLNMKKVKYEKIMRPTIEIVSSIGIASSIVYLIISKAPMEGVVSLFVGLYMTYEPLKKIGEVYNRMKTGEASLRRMEYILGQKEECMPDPQQNVPIPSVKGDIHIENVSFKYLEEWILQNITLSIPTGSVVALVGPSGAGKTTLVDLIPRFYDVQHGCVKIDGRDVRSVSMHDLRAAVSMVPQDTFLFNETILENIRIGRPEAADEQVFEAARHAFAHEFILDMDWGYQTVVGERGTRLSGGQRQRIALARAFLKNAPILILDEATSSLDSESEKKIQFALNELIHDKTVVMIAHRFSTIKMADTTVVMEKGRIRGVGSHRDLYQTNELYTKLYDRQFIG